MKTSNTDKRRLLVETALQLFYLRGIHAVGINEVLKVSGVARKTLYSHFGSKDELIAATVEQRDQVFQRWLNTKMKGARAGAASIDAFFAALHDWINEQVPELGPFRGCFFINVSAEYSQPGCRIFAGCQRHKQALRDLLREHVALYLKHASLGGGSETQIDNLTDSLLQLKEGAVVTAHIMGDNQAALKAQEAARQLLMANQMMR
ncbi:MAG: TetR/AcrR family transcriptional regulator [Marinobacterium sp.]|nr:TetR/AcrR family transcriptional regulator [Marinobacterium sp.]